MGLFPPVGPTVVYEDNKASITMANDPGIPHKRSKFFGIEFAFFKQSVELGEIKPEYVPTEVQPADMLTKILPRPKFSMFRDLMTSREKSMREKSRRKKAETRKRKKKRL